MALPYTQSKGSISKPRVKEVCIFHMSFFYTQGIA